MRRLTLPMTLCLLGAAVLVGGTGGPPARAESAPPNLVVIVTDDMRADQVDTMPTVMGELVGKGRSFERAFASDPLCCPSRMSFLRGQYAHTTSVYNVQYTYGGWSRIRDAKLEASTLATWLDAAGYFTAEIGKYMNGYNQAVVPPGWDYWRGKKGNSFTKFSFLVDGRWRNYDGAYDADVVTGFAVEAVQRSGAEPLFMWASYYAPHNPMTPPARYDTDAEAPVCANEDIRSLPSFNEADMTDKPRWLKGRGSWSASKQLQYGVTMMKDGCRTLLAVDDGVRAILTALEAKDPGLDNTLILFTSDQGAQMGQHRHPWKKVPYEETVRIPFVVRADALLGEQPSNDADHMVANIDLAPTFLELARIDPASVSPGCPDTNDVYEDRCVARGGGFDGTSFAPLLIGGPYLERSVLLLEHWDPVTLTGKVPTYCSIRTETAKLTRYFFNATKGPDWEGYDLAADPNELNSLVYSSSDGVPKSRGARGAEILATLGPMLVELCDPLPPEYPPF